MKDWDWPRRWSTCAGAASPSALPGGRGGICEELTLRVRSRVVLRRVESCCRCSSNNTYIEQPSIFRIPRASDKLPSLQSTHTCLRKALLSLQRGAERVGTQPWVLDATRLLHRD